MGLGLEEGGGLDDVLGKVFSVHLHNQWEKVFPSDGWVERLLLRRYDKMLVDADVYEVDPADALVHEDGY
jgi:hypothetical protein